ncbi:hypothetical protein ACWM35_11290 [Neobacillus sp. K501]
MDATTWQTISIVAYSLAGVLVATAIFLYFKLNIRAIIGDLTGRTAARQIQEIREQNQLTGHKLHQPNLFNIQRGSLTEPVESRRGKTGTSEAFAHQSKLFDRVGQTKTTSQTNVVESFLTEVNQASASIPPIGEETVILAEATTLLFANEVPSAATEVLADETEVLLTNETEVLEDGTEVLTEDEGTTVLYPTVELEPEEVTEIQVVEFKIVKDIKVTHTNEVI